MQEVKLAIDPSDPVPLYAQLEREIRIGIATGSIRPGDRLPTVRQLAVELRINANTVARVYLGLEREGVLVTKRGVGTFVAEAVPPKTQAPYRERQLRKAIDRLITDATSLGFKPREIVRALARRIREGV